MGNFTGKTILVSGASSGIGKACVKSFAAQGAKLILCARSLEKMQEIAEKLKDEFGTESKVLQVDVRNRTEVEAAINSLPDEWTKIDILVNNAGVTSSKQIFDMTDEDFDSVIRINLSAPFKCTREVSKVMRQHGGSIINTSSMVGTYGGKMQTAYSSSKFGINGLTKSCAKELGAYNIRVNAVAPGVVATDMMKNSVNQQMLDGLNRMTPLGRSAEPDELAGAYVYLASDEASFTTGTIVNVDGGIVM